MDGVPIEEGVIAVKDADVFEQDVLAIKGGEQGFRGDGGGVGLGVVSLVGV